MTAPGLPVRPVLGVLPAVGRVAGAAARWSSSPTVCAGRMRLPCSPTSFRTTAAPCFRATAPAPPSRWRPSTPPTSRRGSQLCEQWDAIEDLVLDALFRPFPPVMPMQRLLRRIGLGSALRLARLAALPVRRFGEETFRGAGGPMLLAGNALHADLSPDAAGSAIYGWLLTMLGPEPRVSRCPKGGAGRLADALVARLEARGGVVRLDEPGAPRFASSDGVATGVELASGEIVNARRAVLADVPAPNLYSELVGARAPAAAADRRPRELPVGRVHAQDRLGAVGAGAVDRRRRPRGRHRSPRGRSRWPVGLRDGAVDPTRSAGTRSSSSVR